MKAIRRFTVRTVLPEPIRPLARLATNLRWSWHRPTRQLFEGLNPKIWAESSHDPVSFLGLVSREELQRLAADQDVVRRVHAAAEDLDRYLEQPRWYQSLGDGAPACIAYFSPEFGITEVLPQYSGGLGILAGDHLKAASDLGVPLIGVGLLYQAGYFKQSLSRDAWQQETYPVLDPDGLPLTLLREASADGNGKPIQISLPLPHGRRLLAHVWRADVGRVPLLLLDSNVPGNDEAARGITDRLYGGGGDHRLQQELLLGMGGVKALRAFQKLTGSPAPEVFHTNEGHAGFLGVERIQEMMAAAEPLSWDEALAAGRASTVFTTHTPVPAGIDRFEVSQIQHFFDAGLAPDVPVAKILDLGRENYTDGNPFVFNMAVMGLRLAQRANGVAKLHGVVSRGMFSALWPGFDHSEVPITSVTNGVHVPTWVDPRVSALARDQFGAEAEEPGRWDLAYNVSDEDVWALRRELRVSLVEDVRRRLRAAWKKRGAADAELALDGFRAGPGHPDHRLRPARAHLQAAHPHAARARAAQGPAAAQDPPDPAGHRRQVAPGRRRGQEDDPGPRPVHRRSRGAAPDRVPAELRHRHGPDPVPGLRCVAEQPAASARGVRHVRHEGRPERLAQPLRPGRLVGRDVRRRERLGDSDRQQRTHPPRNATTSRLPRCTSCWRRRWPRASTA